MSEEHALEMRLVHAQNDRWYVVDRNQNTYGGSFATKQDAIDYMFDDGEEEQ